MQRLDTHRPLLQRQPTVETEIKELLDLWINTVCTNEVDDILTLYDSEAVLHPTISPVLVDNHDKRREYFSLFKQQGQLSAQINECRIRIFDEMAINSGTYTFIVRKDGQTREIPARFSFTYRKTPNGWKIVDHHSSPLPEPSIC